MVEVKVSGRVNIPGPSQVLVVLSLMEAEAQRSVWLSSIISTMMVLSSMMLVVATLNQLYVKHSGHTKPTYYLFIFIIMIFNTINIFIF